MVGVNPALAQFSGGSGTQADPYQIATAADLDNVRNYLDSHFIMTGNLDLSTATGDPSGDFWNAGAGWIAIGYDDTSTFMPVAFTGTFDGGGHTILGLYMSQADSAGVGLFKYLGSSGVIKNVGLANVDITGFTNVGGLIGGTVVGNPEMDTLPVIDSVFVTGTVTGGDNVGGVIGNQFAGNLSHAWSSATVVGTGGFAYYGGLVGYMDGGSISESYATGSVTESTGFGSQVGGLVGGAGGGISLTISDSYATGAVSGYDDVAGLVGAVFGGVTITNSYATGAVSGDVSAVNLGGLVGFEDDYTLETLGNTYNSSYWDSMTTGQASSAGGTAKTTTEMQTQSTFTGWDFTGTWQMDGYPGLRNLGFGPANFAPTATNVVVSNTSNPAQPPAEGDVLTVSYDYNDTEGDVESGTTIQWYRADDGVGTNAVLIAGATVTSYTVAAADAGKFLRVDVVPSDGTNTGSAASSSYVEVPAGNTPPVVASAIADFAVNEDAADSTIDLTTVFADGEEAAGELTYTLISNSDTTLISASIDNVTDLLTLSLKADSSGTSTIIVQAEDNEGLSVQDSFVLTVNAVNDAPVVSTPIADVTVDENAANTVIDLSTNFSDVETTSGSLIYTVEVNDNPTLVTATINDSALTLDYQTNQFGVANITVRGSDGELSVDDSFVVTVNEANKAPVFAESYDVSTALHAGEAEEFSVGAQESTPRSITFNGDGTKMFIIGPSGNAVVEYALGVAWDVSTAVYAGAEEEFSVIAQETDPTGLTFNGDGTKMFIIGPSGDAVVEYTLGVAWDVSTAVYGGSEEEFSVSAQETIPTDFTFNGDGTKMFVIGFNDDAVVEYSLGVAWDVSTAVYAGMQEEFSIGAQETIPYGLIFNGEGTKMFIIGPSGDAVVEYTLGVAWDVSTAVYKGAEEEFSVGNEEISPLGLTFNGDGTKLFVIGENGIAIVEYSLAPGTPRTTTFAENGTGTVIDVFANNGNGGAADEGLTYSISGGTDGSLFNIDASTGILTFKAVPDFENPADADGNNEYEVIVQADDGQEVNNTSSITLTITVTNANETPFVTTPISDVVVDENSGEYKIIVSPNFKDPETASELLSYSVTAIDDPTVVIGLFRSDTLSLYPQQDKFGTTNITVSASDGEFSVANTFNVTVNEVLSVNPANAFITTWTTTGVDETVTIPTTGGTEITDFDFTVDWGDGSIERFTGDDPDPSHTYATAGTHTIQIEGTFPYMNAGADGDLNQLSSIEQWGNNAWENMVNTFAWARNMVYNATDAPNLSNVTSTAGMFFAAEKVNGDLSSWNTSTITDMSFMFDGATIFNGNITTWDVSSVTNMKEMFQNADSLNQDLSQWNVSAVTNMQGVFQDTDSFNGNVSTWNTSAVTNMFGMFANAAAFNQPLANWDVSKVTDFGAMFLNAASFDQDISDWNISSATRLDNGSFGFLQGSSFSQQNYDMLLHKWNQLANLPENLSLNVGSAKYGPASAAHDNLTGFKGWTLTDGGRYNMFVTTWVTSTEQPTIQLGTVGGENITDFDVVVDWGDGTVERFVGDAPVITHTYSEFGTETIRIAGIFPEMNASAEGATISNLRSVVLWGDIQWESMASMFAGADSLEFRNLDTPDLSSVSSMENMFFSLGIQSSFNSDISGWDVSSVTNMELMFAGAKDFNQDISGWDVSSVTNMGGMFAATESFDQNLGNWNIQNVDTFDFFGTIGSSTVQIEIGFKQDAELSTSNYDSTLIGWAEKVTANSNIKISFGNSLRSIISTSSYNSLTDLGWTINDGGSSSEFTTRWQTTSPNETVTIPTGGGTEITDFDFIIDWGDGTIETVTGDDPDPMHTYANAGTYTVMIGGVFPHMNAEVDGDLDQLISLESWGSIQWEDMTRMFAWARNMVYNATDAPDLSNATSTAAMFFAAEKLNADLNNWDVSTITDMSFMFDGATAFNGDVSSWNTSNVTTMRDMFQFATSFNQDISGWDVSKVTDLRNMLNNASAFDQNLGDWQIGSVEFMQAGSQGFLEGTALSIINYDSLLIKWSEQTLPMNLTLDVDSTNYSRRSEQSRQKIIDAFNWTIIDGGIGLSKIDLIARNDRFSVDSVLIMDVLGDDVPLSDSEANFTWTAINLADSTNLTGFVAPSFNADSSYWELETRDIKLNYTTGVNFNISVEVEIPELSVLETGKENVELYNNFYFAENGVTIKAPDAEINEQGFVIIDGEPVIHTKRDRAGLESLRNKDVNNPEFVTSVTTGITDMSNLFRPVQVNLSGGGKKYVFRDFNQDISSWDVSSVTNMAGMFSGRIIDYYCEPHIFYGSSFCHGLIAVPFNQDISNWDVSNVTNMSEMFLNATDFNQDISNWDVSKVTDMSRMFYRKEYALVLWGKSAFNADISSWNVSSVRNMEHMFYGSNSFNQNLSNWDVSNVTNMNGMFNGASSFDNGNRPGQKTKVGNGKEVVSSLNWNVSQVTNMASMFQGAESFNQDISSWDISSVQYFDNAPDTSSTQAKVNSSAPDSISGFLVGSGMSSDNVSKMFVGWKDKVNSAVQSINIGSIELNSEGATALRALRESSNIVVSWGGEEGVDDEPVFSPLPEPFEILTEDTRILQLWDYVSDVSTPDNALKFSFSVVSDSLQTIGFDTNSGELAITAPAYADTFFVAIQVANIDNIVALDTVEVHSSPMFTSSEDMVVDIPSEFDLMQNYPNPFNPTTVIRFGVPQAGEVRLEVFDLLGRKVATLLNNERRSAGWHQVTFDARNLASGIYIYRISTGNFVKSHRMTLIK
ncbi:BspA family leucine-rich repeat surface protein [Balneola vulgaris]|uniref:BspA family leucine-rich repeat surface protein n=1 Tax=Balneola vulgaris TaxID=287535 RepID=UPI00037B39A9